MKKIELIGSEVSKAIKDMLKSKFPKCKFSVRYDSFAGGNSVDVNYVYGPNIHTVEELVNPYQSGKYNGMIDMYEYHGEREVVTKDGEFTLKGGVKFITVTKDYPEGMFGDWKKRAAEILIWIKDPEELRIAVRQAYLFTDFQSASPQNLRISRSAIDLDPLWTKLAFEFDPIEVKEPKKLELVQYSEYSFAVFGSTYDASKKLKDMGRFNRFLTHPVTQEKTPGWIFSNKNLEKVKQTLQIA